MKQRRPWSHHKKAKESLDEKIRQLNETSDQRTEPETNKENLLVNTINNLKSWQVFLIIFVIGFIVFSSGLRNPFQGDDYTQVVNSIPVHSITNIKEFFDGGTFYSGSSVKPLAGAYYRPLMITTFSLIYTLFGPQTFYFHLLQLLLYIGSTFLLYLVFRNIFNTILALALSLIFLVHPINSQVVYAIPSMQDALFFFFGILGFWLLIRFNSIRSLALVALCFFFSLLGKETGILFVIMAALYLVWFDRKRIWPYSGFIALPVIFWIVLKVHAVGLNPSSHVAPIDSLSLGGRLMTAPSLFAFYFFKMVFPIKLAQQYQWIYPSFSFQHVLLPLIIDLAILGIAVYAGYLVRCKLPRALFYSYLLFAVWATLGLLVHLQIIVLDMTACEAWFYFPFAGVLGMIGIAMMVFQKNINPTWFIAAVLILVIVLGYRSFERGFNYSNMYKLAYDDIAASKENFIAYTTYGANLIDNGNYEGAKYYIQKAASIYPDASDYNDLGEIYAEEGNYAEANNTYEYGVRLGGEPEPLYDNIGELTEVTGSFSSDQQYLESALNVYPHDSQLWMYLAILEQKVGNNNIAKEAIANAAAYGQVPNVYYNGIMDNKSFYVNVINLGKVVFIK